MPRTSRPRSATVWATGHVSSTGCAGTWRDVVEPGDVQHNGGRSGYMRETDCAFLEVTPDTLSMRIAIAITNLLKRQRK